MGGPEERAARIGGSMERFAGSPRPTMEGLHPEEHMPRLIWGAAALVVSTAAVVGVVALAELGEPEPEGPTPSSMAPSCVETYLPTAIASRAFAFDGTVTGIGPARTNRTPAEDYGLNGVTFAVSEWFHGGTGDTVAVDLPPPGAGESAPSFAVGTRLLVSGEPRWGGAALADPIAWPCGFTRSYDAATATAWRGASSGT
jgi:hypothetical protein